MRGVRCRNYKPKPRGRECPGCGLYKPRDQYDDRRTLCRPCAEYKDRKSEWDGSRACIKCRERKPKAEFDGRRRACRECVKTFTKGTEK